jgi:Domain of unknown function (DUF4116)
MCRPYAELSAANNQAHIVIVLSLQHAHIFASPRACVLWGGQHSCVPNAWSPLRAEDLNYPAGDSYLEALAAVTEDGLSLSRFPDFCGTKSVVVAAVTENGSALDFATPDLRSDPDVVLAAVRNDGVALVFAGAQLRDTPAVAFSAVLQEPLALEVVSQRLLGDPALVFLAATRDARALRFASFELRSDPAFIIQLMTCQKSTRPRVLLACTLEPATSNKDVLKLSLQRKRKRGAQCWMDSPDADS